MRCSHWTNNTTTECTESGRLVEVPDYRRCANEATVWLFDDAGDKVPGCWYCDDHAQAIIKEYREKLAELWTARPINHLGDVL